MTETLIKVGAWCWFACQLLLFGLRITGTVRWSWALVCLPIWVIIGLIMLTCGILLVTTAVEVYKANERMENNDV